MNQLRHKLTLLLLVCIATIGGLLAGCATRSPEQPKRVDVSKLPRHLKAFLPSDAPLTRGELLKLVRPGDLPQLHELFKHLPLKQRGSINLVLGYIGDRTSIDLLTNALTREFPGSKFDDDEVATVSQMLNSLGHLSAQYPEAYDFLHKGVEEDFWPKRRQWTAEEENDVIDVKLARSSLQNLGHSGRVEVPQLLEELKGRDAAFLYSRSSYMVDSAFNCEMVQKYGRQVFITRDHGELFHTWIQGDYGKAWHEWGIYMLSTHGTGKQPGK